MPHCGTQLTASAQRPVEWILWNPTSQTALIIIPEEAELLIPVIRKKATIIGQEDVVHLVTYMAPLSRDMLPFNHFSFYSIPPLPASHQVSEWLSMELGIFAGRTFADFTECIALKKSMERQDGAIFSANPSGFLFEWLTLRRKEEDITHTPIGFICHGRPLDENHNFFVGQEAGCEGETEPLISGGEWLKIREKNKAQRPDGIWGLRSPHYVNKDVVMATWGSSTDSSTLYHRRFPGTIIRWDSPVKRTVVGIVLHGPWAWNVYVHILNLLKSLTLLPRPRSVLFIPER